MTLVRNLPLFILAAAVTPHAFSQEKKVERRDLPPAVEKALTSVASGAEIRGFATEKENGQIFYEVQLSTHGRKKDVLMDATGQVVEVEEEITLDALAPAVRDGLQARAGKGKLIKVESITKHDKLVAYEAQVLTGSRKSEVQIGPDGKALNHEE